MSSRLAPVQSLDPSEQAGAGGLSASTAAVKARLRAAGLGGSTTPSSNSTGDEELSSPTLAQHEESESKFDDGDLLVTKTPLLGIAGPSSPAAVHAKREEIRAYFHKTFSLYERLFDVLASEDTFAMQPEKLRHPLIFYFGHTAVFFINKLRLAGLLKGRINEALESTLAIGVDEMSWDDLNTAHYVWPTVEQVRAYRDACRVVVDDLISSLPLQLPLTWESPLWVVLMGCEHERIHLETSSVLFRQLPVEQVRPASPGSMWSPCTSFRADRASVPRNELVPVPGGKVALGNSQDSQRVYGWDLEYGTHTADVPAFAAGKFLVSNAEFHEFVANGGYEDPELWGEEGAKFVAFRQAKHPVFWRPVEETEGQGEEGSKDDLLQQQQPSDGSPSPAKKKFLYRSMTAEQEMPWDWPVDVNYIEAKAFCAWKNRARTQRGEDGDGLVYRLPTEEEYARLRDEFFPAEKEVEDEETKQRRRVRTDQPDWDLAPGNINLEHGASSCPVDRFAFSSTSAGAQANPPSNAQMYDVVGNVWQWTETPVMAWRGFRFHPLYDDFSVPTFDTRHNVITGGSWISTGNEATRTARFAFRRHFYQHAGFRYILARPLSSEESSSASSQAKSSAMCETDPAVVAMLDAQYNDAGLVTLQRNLRMQPQENFAAQIAQIAVDAYKAHGRTGTPLVANEEGKDAVATTLASPGPRALDIGCACGRSTFELAKLAAAASPSADASSSSSSSSSPAPAPLFNHILGLDFSTRFIRLAAQLQFEGHAEYAMAKEGTLLSFHSIESQAGAPPAHTMPSGATSGGAVDVSVSTAPSVVDLDLRRVGMHHRLEFLQGDACNLAAKYTGFDLVLASNLLETLYSPRAFLTSIGGRIRAGGILVLASSYGWTEQQQPSSAEGSSSGSASSATGREHWLGGFKDGTGESVSSARAVGELLEEHGFEALPQATQELPVIWKQDQRHFALRFAQVTVWRKK